MSKAISALVAYTHNTRAVYSTKIKAEFVVTVDDDNKAIITVPDSVSQEQVGKYKAGGTIFIAGEEVIGTLLYGTAQNAYSNLNDFYSSQGVRPILTREFKGSTYNGGFYKIKSVTGHEIELDVQEGEIIEETFNGVICISL